MADTTNVAGGTAAAGGTASADSKATQASQVSGSQGAEGAQAQEPTVEINGEQVPISDPRAWSKVQAGLGAMKSYTQTTQKLSERERDLEQRELAMKGAAGLVEKLSDPTIAAKVGEVAPEVIQAVPSREVQLADAVLAENISLRFQNFANEHPEFDGEQLKGIAAEARRLATSGRIEEARDFDAIGLRLYRDDILAAERARAIAEAQAQQQQALQAGVVPGGTVPVPKRQDTSKLSGIGKLAHGHAEREAKQQRRR